MIFDKAWQKFIVEQAPPAVKYAEPDGKYLCSYLTPEGTKCAVGLCVPDGHPLQHEGCTLGTAIVRYPELFDPENEVHPSIQLWLHDDLIDLKTGKWNESVEQRREKYLEVARLFNLKVPE